MKDRSEILSRDDRHAKLAAFLEKIGREMLCGHDREYGSYEITLPVSPGALRFAAIDTTGTRHELTGRHHQLARAMYEWAVSGVGQCPADAISNPEEWMFEAAFRIDQELGLSCRFDNSVTYAARIIAEQHVIALGQRLIQSDGEE